MATKSRADGSNITNDWKAIVELAHRLDEAVASGKPPNPEDALTLARAVLSRSGPPSGSEVLPNG
jgi:hypothetical protein